MAPFGSGLFPVFPTSNEQVPAGGLAKPSILPEEQEEMVEEIAKRHSARWMRGLTDLVIPQILTAVRAHIAPEDPLQRSFIDPSLGHRRVARMTLEVLDENLSEDEL